MERLFLRFSKKIILYVRYIMKQDYYKKNKENWKKGGKYYYYKPKESTGELTIKTGIFIISFD
tara:strand:- start:254 stop:442 length:189 start_codon:yes stop_codon:yes gene_type:complete